MFRFTIRDVLWLTVLVALAATWWLHSNSLRSEFSKQLRAAKLRQQKTEQELLSVNLLRKREEMVQEAIRARKAELDVVMNRKAWAASKSKSQELGAPRPKPLP